VVCSGQQFFELKWDDGRVLALGGEFATAADGRLGEGEVNAPRLFIKLVGPNGSGMSNVIDSMLFVFGKRAKQGLVP
jgi:hypothetical protein